MLCSGGGTPLEGAPRSSPFQREDTVSRQPPVMEPSGPPRCADNTQPVPKPAGGRGSPFPAGRTPL